MYRTSIALIILALGASTYSLRAEEEVACKGVEQILTELHDLRALIENKAPTRTAPRTPTVTKMAVPDAPFLGSQDAPVVIVEFTDYECPFCQRFFKETFPSLKKLYIDPGKVKFYVTDLPLEMHKQALLAAQAAHCAGDQGQFWQMHDKMQGNPEVLEKPSLLEYATSFGLDEHEFERCLDTEKYRGQIQEGASAAQASGARGTPAFFIGKNTASGLQGEFLIGAEPLGNFEKQIKDLMESN